MLTPHLVSLARRLEGRPFHLLAAHCQPNSRENVVKHVRRKGLALDTPNFTITRSGGHPKVTGSGYVPYYMVFDHHGDLVHHHMSGAFHGGDGLGMARVVDRLLKAVPEIYLGKEPYTAVPELAKKVGNLDSLRGAIVEFEGRWTQEDRDEASTRELWRLRNAVVRYRERELAKADVMLGRDPTRVLPILRALNRRIGGTVFGQTVGERLRTIEESDRLEDSIALHAALQRVLAELDEKSDESLFKRETRAATELEELIRGKESLPFARRVKEAIASLRE